jgi:flagellar biosynthesis GTPase FlhF
MNEYETPLDQIRPVSTSNKQFDPNTVMDYNEILNSSNQQQSNQQQNNQQQHNQQQNNQQQSNESNVENENNYQFQQMQQQQYQQQQYQQQPHPHTDSSKQQSKDSYMQSFSLSDYENKDYIFLILANSIIFSDGIQKSILKYLPNLFKDGKPSIIGLLFNAILVAFLLFLSKKIKIKV